MSINKDQHIVIFGASSGMGEAIAKACINKGYHISICARRQAPLQKIANRKPQHCYIEQVDATDKQQVSRFVNHAIKKFGKIDTVINCVGVMYYQRMSQCDYDEWMKMINTNIIGFLNITQAILPPLIETQGMFINITSDAGRQAFAGLAVYSGTKAFMEFTLKAMRYELVEKGVRVINLQPGNVATDLHTMSSDKKAVDRYASHDSQNFLTPQDIAQSVLYVINQPRHVAINEILIEPQQEPI
ncbi:SDR family oxidoreductase [Facilibium subflavum]|uniref:SDR family oxidoreductase n=1 Tax=Facilibium subflavum TaxID=2219058 RepID=UPI000E64E06C|nr:SDR family oxidoreductase [Facilibium subflavum]